MKADPHERKLQPQRLETPNPWGLIVLGALIAAPIVASAQPSTVQSDLQPPQSSNLLLAFGAILLSILLNAVFVAAETSLELLRSSHAKNGEKETQEYKRIQDLVDHRGKYFAACTLASQTMRSWMIIFCFLPAPWLAQRVSVALGQPNSWLIILLTAVLLTIPVAALNMVFGELVPRAVAASKPVGVASKTYPWVKAAAAFAWVSSGIAWVANLFTKRFGTTASFALPRVAEEEIKIIVESAKETGEIEDEEREMITSVFEFGDTVAREVMTPRVDLDALPIESAPQELIELIGETGHSRIPLYEDSDDQIVGIIHAKDLLKANLQSERPVNLRTLMRPVLFVPETKNLHDLLQEMKLHRTQMAIVQDEFGGTAGVVTIEDIVEELVGDIIDEYDREESEIIENGNSWGVAGKTNLWDVNQAIGTNLESEEFDSLGGFLFGLFGRQPKEGEFLEHEGWRYTVRSMDGRRISQVLVEPAVPGEVESL